MTDDGTAIDGPTLEAYLSAQLDEPELDTEVLHDGLNLAVGISTPAERRAYVLRRPRRLRDTELFNDLEREYRLLERLEATPVPAPTPVLYCDDESILGGPFFVTTYLDGDPVPMETRLADRFPTPAARRAVATGLVETLADVHRVDVDRVADVCDRRTPREQVRKDLDRLDRTRRVTGRELPRLRDVAEWLLDHAPPAGETALVHGDFKPGNVLFSGTDHPDVTGVLDWETGAVGDPRTELGYLLGYWRDAGDPTPSVGDVEAEHAGDPGMETVRAIAAEGFYPFTTLPGSPTRRELVGRYEDLTGIAFENDRFYRAQAALGLAAVWEDLHRHQVEAGAGASSDYPPLVAYMSRVAADIVAGDRPL